MMQNHCTVLISDLTVIQLPGRVTDGNLAYFFRYKGDEGFPSSLECLQILHHSIQLQIKDFEVKPPSFTLCTNGSHQRGNWAHSQHGHAHSLKILQRKPHLASIPAITLSYLMNRGKFMLSAGHRAFWSITITGDDKTLHYKQIVFDMKNVLSTWDKMYYCGHKSATGTEWK